MNTSELAKSKGAEVFDTALPQGWVDDFYKKMNIWPAACGMYVWCYDEARYFGKALPLTEEAEKLLVEFAPINESGW